MKGWSAVFAALFGMLVIRNRFLFSTPLHELGDSGANSIIVNQAKHFSLLVGNYSRQGFSHPGPAYFYLEAFGEWLFYDLLKVVPTPWNGQLIAIYALNAALLATVTWIIQQWTGSWLVATTCLLVTIALISLQPNIINDAWMPFVYVPSFLLLLVAATSVAAGRSSHLWALALAGGLLVHGHAAFLLFVPIVAGVAFLKGRPTDRRQWTIALAVLAIFLLPIAVNTVVHWPGEFAKYFGYGSSAHAGSKSILDSFSYVLWYWWPGGLPIVALGLLAFIKQPFARAGLLLSLLVTALLVYYAYAGIDNLEDPYMGFFYWGVPLFAAITLTMWAATRLPNVSPIVPMAALIGLIAIVPGFRSSVGDHNSSVPETLRALKAYAAGRPMVVEIAADNIGPELAGLLNWARRDGFRACLRDAHWSFMTTPEYICSAQESATGVVIVRLQIGPETPRKPGEIARTGTSAFVTSTAATAHHP